MNLILAAAICTACVGIFVGIFLGVAGIAFKVETDEREEKVLAALPGNNCGGCGYAMLSLYRIGLCKKAYFLFKIV